jgi:hypothetical protein
MGGSQRMFDPSEAAHDRVRRRCMNLGLLLVAALQFGQWRWFGMTGGDWWRAGLLAIAGLPLGVSVRVFELRFKLAAAERRRLLADLPVAAQLGWVIYSLLLTGAALLQPQLFTWPLVGLWLNDFYQYYRDRPERMRHLYAVTKTLDELRPTRAPWVWALPALIAGLL